MVSTQKRQANIICLPLQLGVAEALFQASMAERSGTPFHTQSSPVVEVPLQVWQTRKKWTLIDPVPACSQDRSHLRRG